MARLHTISVNEEVNQKVLALVSSSFFTFFNIDTKLTQKIMPNNGMNIEPIVNPRIMIASTSIPPTIAISLFLHNLPFQDKPH
jgi:hypothetical protein